MKLFLRDDDTSYFTKVSELEKAFEGIWDYGPVNLAIIPYAVETFNQGLLNEQFQTQKEFFIGDNLELVEFIKNKIKEGKVNVMLHGYNHYYKKASVESNIYPFGIPEFIYSENQFERIKKGKIALEKLFDVQIKWFIPPSNSLKIETLIACDNLKLNLPLVLNLKKRLFYVIFDNPINFFVNRYNKFTLKNFPLKFKNHKEIMCVSFTSATNFNNKVQYSGNEVIATHYWELNRYPSIKNELIKELKRFNFELHSMNDI